MISSNGGKFETMPIGDQPYLSPYVILPDGTKATFFDIHGNLNVAIQDQHTQFFDFKLCANPGYSTVATVPTIDTNTLIVADASNASVGNYAAVFSSPYGQVAEYYVGQILAIATNTLSLDTPVNYEFAIGDIVLFRDPDIHLADGSTTPVIYDLPLPATGTISFDVTRIIIIIECPGEPGDALFGDMAALTNGIVFRHNSAQYGIRNIWNAKTNGDFAAIAYDVTYTDKAGGGYGVRCLLEIAGQKNHGVTIRLDPGDALELVVQDDLTDLDKFNVVVQGHVVD